MRQKKQKLIEYNKNNIEEAARILFQKNGIVQTTVDDIAREADCSKATIYVYFKNKDDIYYHLVLDYMNVLEDAITACFTRRGDFKAAFLAFCHTLAEFGDRYPMYFECVLGSISIDEEMAAELPVLQEIYKVGERIKTAAYDAVVQAQQEGWVDDQMDALQVVFVLWSSLGSIITFAAKKKDYLEKSLGVETPLFLENSFALLFKILNTEKQL